MSLLDHWSCGELALTYDLLSWVGQRVLIYLLYMICHSLGFVPGSDRTEKVLPVHEYNKYENRPVFVSSGGVIREGPKLGTRGNALKAS